MKPPRRHNDISNPVPATVALAIFILLVLTNRTYAEEPLFIPAQDAEVVRLDNPTHRIAPPKDDKNARGPDLTFELDPDWRIERAAITADGQTAYLLVYTLDRIHQTRANRYVGASIRRISLTTGEQTGQYDLPEPFALSEFPGAWGTGNAGLAVSADGESIITAYMPIHLFVGGDAHQKYAKSLTFFRWGEKPDNPYVEKLVPYGPSRWKFIPYEGRLIVWHHGGDSTKIECWQADDLSVTPWVEFLTSPFGENRRDGTISIYRECITYDKQQDTLDIMHHWRVRSSEKRPLAWREWLQKYDTKTGKPIGRATRFENKHMVIPWALCGEHLLLLEQDRERIDHRTAAHVWNIRTLEHVASIDTTPITKSHINRVDLTEDGSAIVYENRLLNLQTLEWTADRSGSDGGNISASSPDGRYKVIIQNPDILKTEASPKIKLYHLN